MSDTSDHAMHVVVAPKRSLPLSSNSSTETIFHELQLTKLAPTDPSNLARHLAVLLSSSVSTHDLPQALASAAMSTSPQFQPSRDDVRFAEFVSFERVIPIEQSPLS